MSKIAAAIAVGITGYAFSVARDMQNSRMEFGQKVIDGAQNSQDVEPLVEKEVSTLESLRLMVDKFISSD